MGRIEDIDAKLKQRLQAIEQKIGGRMQATDQRVAGRIQAIEQKIGGRIREIGGNVGGPAAEGGGAGEGFGTPRGMDAGVDAGRSPGGVVRMGLCVGLNVVDDAAYAGSAPPLAGCVADAERFSCVLTRMGFQVLKLLDVAATCAGVYLAIRRAVEILRSGDLFVMSISGHGGRQADFGSAPRECWCLHDGRAWDSDIVWAFSQFRPGVRILAINDQCHSGGMFQARGGFGETPFGRLCAEDGKPAGWDAGRALRGTGYPQLIQFAGCRAEQSSMDGLGGGTWTQALVNVLDEANARGRLPTYREWFDAAFASPTLRRGRQDPQWVESSTVTDAFRESRALS